MSVKMRARALLTALLCLCLLAPCLLPSPQSVALAETRGERGVTAGVTRQADPSTMDTYRDVLELGGNSRYAGRLWTDKTVFANEVAYSDEGGRVFDGTTLYLTPELDGITPKSGQEAAWTTNTVELNSDFLHVFSVLASSQNVNTENVRPLDVVLLLDISESMCDNNDRDPLHTVVSEANQLIAKLMNNDGETKVDSEGNSFTSVDPSVHTANRVAVVGYGGGTQVLMELDHYRNRSTNYLSATERYAEQSHNYFSQITVNADGDVHRYVDTQSDYMFANSTYLQGALYQGMRMLAEETNTKYSDGRGNTFDRIPVLVVLTDGATNISDVTSTATNSTALNWWNPLEWAGGNANRKAIVTPRNENPDAWNGTLTPANNNPIYIPDVTLNNMPAVAPRTMTVLLTAGYMKKRIEENYNKNLEEGQDKIDLMGFGVGINVSEYNEGSTPGAFHSVHSLQYAQLMGTMNPRQFIVARSASDARADSGLEQLRQVYDELQHYVNHEDVREWSYSGVEVGLGTDNAWRAQTATWRIDHPTDTTYDITSIEDVYYIDQYMEASTDTIGDIFDAIFEDITAVPFVPVGGENDMGVGDQVTYMDPVGKYMEIKDVEGITLFGHHHTTTLAGVYDFEFNDAFMEENAEKYGLMPGVSPFPRGWYRSPDGTGANAVPAGWIGDDPVNGNPKLPDGCDNSAQARAAGWEFYFDFPTLTSFVPSLKDVDEANNLSPKAKATKYAFYRFVGDNIGTGDDDSHISQPHANPCYGEKADGSANVTYNINDIRIWVEDTSHYDDTAVGGDSGIMSNAGYDEALWVSIPAEALPVRIAHIAEQPGGSYTYSTNEDDADGEAKPLRIYYSVGISESTLLPDTREIDLAGQVATEYIDHYKADTQDKATERNVQLNDVEFFSNWYQESDIYDGYFRDDGYEGLGFSYGDPVVSFSPSEDNRYYVCERPIPLYKVKADELGDVLGADGQPKELYLDPAQRGPATADYFTKTMHAELVESVDELKDGNAWFYVILSYYDTKAYSSDGEGPALDDGTCRNALVAVPRKAAEFGEGVLDGSKLAASYLCWYNTDDTSTWETLTPEPPDSDHAWVVALRHGALRTGDLSQDVRRKGDMPASIPEGGAPYASRNVTRTANSAYLPTVSSSTDSEDADKLVLDVYLGNNGRLVVSDTTLLVTKEVKAGEGGMSGEAGKTFRYQAFIDGMTGEQSAIVVSRDTNGHWYRRLDYIDLLTSNDYLVQVGYDIPVLVDSAGSQVVETDGGYAYADDGATYNADSDAITAAGGARQTGPFYVYTGDNYTGSGETGDSYQFRLFKNTGAQDSDFTVDVSERDVTVERRPDGSNAYYLTHAFLVPKAALDAEKAEASGGAFEMPTDRLAFAASDLGQKSAQVASVSGNSPNGFLACVWEPGTDDLSARLVSDYLISSAYLTRKVYFGYELDATMGADGTVDGVGLDADDLADKYIPSREMSGFVQDGGAAYTNDYIARHTAEFELGDGEGLLFNAIPNGANYRITEHLRAQDVAAGYDFVSVEHEQNNSKPTYAKGQSGSSAHFARADSGIAQNAPGTAPAAGEAVAAVYSVFGDTGGLEEAAHYINTWTAGKDETQINGEDIPQTSDPVKPGVQIGDTITYEIKWHNGARDASGAPVQADVVIVDALDEGVDFVGATGPYSYDPDTRTVTWRIGRAGADAGGSVMLTVRVNAHAKQYWDYPDQTPGEHDETDFLVRNRASVRVAGNEYTTSTVVNPVEEPDKTETNIDNDATGRHEEVTEGDNLDYVPGETGKLEGPSVLVGDTITYRIRWRNHHNEAAVVTVRDPLDANVRIVSASFSRDDTLVRDPANDVMKKPTDVYPDWAWPPKGAESATLTVDNSANRLDTAKQAPEDQAAFKAASQSSGATVSLYAQPAADGSARIVDDGTTRPIIQYTNADGACEVVWNLGEQPAESEGYVTLVVQVLPGATPVGYVDNTAYVRVGDAAEEQTNILENPTPSWQKEEVSPGAGEQVSVGEEIVYDIDWFNDQPGEATVTVFDPMDKGVDFVSAAILEAGEEELSLSASADGGDAQVTGDGGLAIAYGAEAHTVTWTLPDRAQGASGTVRLTVRVNENASKTWAYYPAPADPDPGSVVGGHDDEDATAPDLRVANRAMIAVDDEAHYTAEIENSVPEKDEADPGDGVMTEVGKEITYRIYWKNLLKDPADVVITDPLDMGGDFVRAAVDEAGTLAFDEAQSAAGKVGVDSADGQYAIRYYPPLPEGESSGGEASGADDPQRHTVTWTLRKRAPGEWGYVLLTVRVNEKAYDAWRYAQDQNRGEAVPGERDSEIIDRAQVQIGDRAGFTSTVENPLPDKHETSPGEGELVGVGETIDYEISWRNDKQGEADVTVVDPLDKGVDFVSARIVEGEGASRRAVLTLEAGTPRAEGPDGAGKAVSIAYDDQAHAVTWTLPDRAAGTRGAVELTVRVNAQASRTWIYDPAPEHADATSPAGGRDGEGMDLRVTDRALVSVDNDAHYTAEVENSVPAKDEADPGDGVMTEVGKEITYRVYWKNLLKDPADVVITDPLDIGGDFVRASIDEAGTLTLGEEHLAQGLGKREAQDAQGRALTVAYEPQAHVATWTLARRAPGESGYVLLTVRVNEKAFDAWRYDPSKNLGASTPGARDFELLNRAQVRIGNRGRFTNTVENPLPEKEEVSPGEGQAVAPGAPVSYRIHWKNGHEEACDVVVTDPLDAGVDFGGASFGPVTLGAGQASASGRDEYGEIAVAYDAARHAVVWTLKGRPGRGQAGSEGDVALQVSPNAKAYGLWQYGAGDTPTADSAQSDNEIVDRASVRVGNDAAVYTRVVRNPLSGSPVPLTGDDTPLAAYLALALLSLAALALLAHAGRRARA